MFAEELRRVRLFDGLEPVALELLARRFRPHNVAANGAVYRYGDDGDSIFVVVSGRLAAYRDSVGKPTQLVTRFEAGDYFGEMCLYDEFKRQTTVCAEEATRLLRIGKAELQEALDGNPRLALRLHVAAAKRRSLEAKAALELGRRAELRIRLGMPMRLEMTGGNVSLTLENISVGGMCLAGVPTDWDADRQLRGTMVVGRVRMPVILRVAWRRGTAAGVAFETRGHDHERVVYRILREIAGVDDGV